MKRVLCLIMICLLLMGIGTGCELTAAIYDDDEQIASNQNTFSQVNVKEKVKGQKYTGSFHLVEGMGTVWTYQAKKDMTLTLTYELNVEKGKAKLVLISPDGSLTTAAEVKKDTESSTAELPIKKGKNRIKLVAGEETKLKLKLSIPKGTFEHFGDFKDDNEE